MPSAKKLIVHGPDLSQIPTQSGINEDTQFLNILQESFEFFGIAESKKDKHFLVDVKTNQMHIPDTYVRNFYFFRRNFSPQLSLVQMDPKEAVKLLEKTAFNLKCLEESKVLLFRKLLDNTVNKSTSSAAFLHEELCKLPMFPRKPLEADFNLYPKLSDRELLTTDMLHKYSWCQLIWSLFSSMDSKTASTWDLTSFLNVINGSFILHADDFNMIRTCLAIYINSAKHFHHVFATNGFLIILPTLVKIYSNNQANPILKNAIEFTCLQFYMIHRIPFILQLFGGVAQILDSNSDYLEIIDTNKIQSTCFLTLLLSMEASKSTDNLKILDLIKGHTLGTSNQNYQEENNLNSSTENILKPGQNNTNGNTLESKPNKDTPNSMDSKINNSTTNTFIGSTIGINGQNTNQSNTTNGVVNLVTTNSLLISSSGALDLNQLNTLNHAYAVNSTSVSSHTHLGAVGSVNTLNQVANINNNDTNKNTNNNNNGNSANNTLNGNNLNEKNNESDSLPSLNTMRAHDDFKLMVNGLDLNYSDENLRFTVIDTVNICVTVVAYASHASRANQMLIILDAILPRYLNYMKTETNKVMALNTKIQPNRHGSVGSQEISQRARLELNNIQKLACALKTLVNTSDFLTRVYNGPKNEQKMDNLKTQNKNAENNTKTKTSIAIQPDDDSMKFSEEKFSNNNRDKLSRAGLIDERQLRNEFRSPRDFLLNILAEFTHLASSRIKELYKLVNDSGLKITELLDTKTHYKLVEIANALLKLWDDSSTLNGNGLQNYFQKLIPITNWSEDDIKPAFSNLLRRVERLFTKISKRTFAKRHLDWTAVAGILNGLYMALDREENLAKILYFKLLINSAITLVMNENMPESTQGMNTSSIFLSQLSNKSEAAAHFQVPVVYSKALIRLVGKYINALKDQSNLEQFYCSIVGTNQMNSSPISMPSGLSYMVNFLLPLLFFSASDRNDSPKLNSSDVNFVISMLLNALKPPSKLAATLLLQAPKQHHLSAFDGASSGVQGKTTKQMKDTITQSTFLAFKLTTYAFYKQLELTHIALTIRQIFSKPKTIFFWRFLEFTCANKTPLFLLIKPFIEAFVASQDCENEQEQTARLAILDSLNCTKPTNSKSKNDVINELLLELKSIQNDIQVAMIRKDSITISSKISETITNKKFNRAPSSFKISARNISAPFIKKNKLNKNESIDDPAKSKRLSLIETRTIMGRLTPRNSSSSNSEKSSLTKLIDSNEININSVEKVPKISNLLNQKLDRLKSFSKNPMRRRTSSLDCTHSSLDCTHSSLDCTQNSVPIVENWLKNDAMAKDNVILSTEKKLISEMSIGGIGIEVANFNVNKSRFKYRNNLEKLRLINTEIIEGENDDENEDDKVESGKLKNLIPDASNDSKLTQNLQNSEAADKDAQNSSTTPSAPQNQRTFDLRAKKLSKTSADKNNQSPAPRKKFEKLNSKTGSDILEIYKSKHLKKLFDQEKGLLGDLQNSPQFRQQSKNLLKKTVIVPSSSSSSSSNHEISPSNTEKTEIQKKENVIANVICSGVLGAGSLVENKEKIQNEAEKENEILLDDKVRLLPKDVIRSGLEMKISKKKKIVFV